MSRELSPPNERFIARALAEGRFTSRELLLDRAVDALRIELAQEDEAIASTHSTGDGLHRFVEPIDDSESRGAVAWDSDAVMRRIFESLAEAGVRTND